MNERRIDRRITEEERRYNGAKLTYRVDELPPGEYKLMTSERTTGCVLDIWKLKQEAAIVVATKLCGKNNTVVPSELLRLHIRNKWMIPERIPVAWGSYDKRIGFIASTFWDKTKYPDRKLANLSPFTLEGSPPIHHDIIFYKMHRYDEDFLLSMYNVQPVPTPRDLP